METYFEHEKLVKVQHLSQAVGEFVMWLGQNGMHICEHRNGEWYMVGGNVEKLLARHFEIDLVRLEEEKRDMLERLRPPFAND